MSYFYILYYYQKRPLKYAKQIYIGVKNNDLFFNINLDILTTTIDLTSIHITEMFILHQS